MAGNGAPKLVKLTVGERLAAIRAERAHNEAAAHTQSRIDKSHTEMERSANVIEEFIASANRMEPSLHLTLDELVGLYLANKKGNSADFDAVAEIMAYDDRMEDWGDTPEEIKSYLIQYLGEYVGS